LNDAENNSKVSGGRFQVSGNRGAMLLLLLFLTPDT